MSSTLVIGLRRGKTIQLAFLKRAVRPVRRVGHRPGRDTMIEVDAHRVDEVGEVQGVSPSRAFNVRVTDEGRVRVVVR